MTDTPLWAVVATVRDPAPLLATFVAHHLDIGATEVLLYADGPPDLLPDLPKGAVVQVCDAAHWARMGGRPDTQAACRRANANHAAMVAKADWLIHLETDCFVQTPRPMAQELAPLTESDLWLRLPVAERVWVAGQPDSGVFDGAFRLALDPEDPLLTEVYGPERAAFLDRGLAGSVDRIGITRLRAGADIGLTCPNVPGSAALPPGRPAQQARVLRFDGPTPRHWVAHLRQMQATPHAFGDIPPGRLRQVDHLARNCTDAAKALAFHDALYVLTLDQATALDAAEALIYARLGPPGTSFSGPSRAEVDTLL